jgi:hypothetical protein
VEKEIESYVCSGDLRLIPWDFMVISWWFMDDLMIFNG